jgi:hypothetical protein
MVIHQVIISYDASTPFLWLPHLTPSFMHAGCDGNRPIVTYEPKERPVAPGPQEVPVIHSSSFILQKREGITNASLPSKSSSSAEERSSNATADADDMSGNAFEWALRQADAYFDKVESESAANRHARLIVMNPATQATMRTMQVRGSQ